jgi:hypothetical protein
MSKRHLLAIGCKEKGQVEYERKEGAWDTHTLLNS